MKIITMQRKTLDGEPVHTEEGNTRDWWCVIETKEEELVYNKFGETISSNIQDGGLIKLWNDMVKHAGQGMGLSWGDDDLYGYILPDETAPEIGEDYTDGDEDIWVRVD